MLCTGSTKEECDHDFGSTERNAEAEARVEGVESHDGALRDPINPDLEHLRDNYPLSILIQYKTPSFGLVPPILSRSTDKVTEKVWNSCEDKNIKMRKRSKGIFIAASVLVAEYSAIQLQSMSNNRKSVIN